MSSITTWKEAVDVIGFDIGSERSKRADAVAEWIHQQSNIYEEIFSEVCQPHGGPEENEDGTYRKPNDAELHNIQIDLLTPTIEFDLRNPSIDPLIEELRMRAQVLTEMADALEANAAAYAEEFGTLPETIDAA